MTYKNVSYIRRYLVTTEIHLDAKSGCATFQESVRTTAAMFYVQDDNPVAKHTLCDGYNQ